MMINYTDIAAAIIIILCVLSAGRRGITYFAVSTIGKIISLSLSVTLHGPVTSLLRQTPLFDIIAWQIKPALSLDVFPNGSVISEHIMANNNSEIYKLFRVDTFSDYVSSYFANIALNIISILIVYLCISAVINVLFKAHRVIARFPLIRGINRTTGIIAGLIEGVIILWILVLILIFFTLQGKFLNIYEMLLTSKFAIYFLRYNILIGVIFNIMP